MEKARKTTMAAAKASTAKAAAKAAAKAERDARILASTTEDVPSHPRSVSLSDFVLSSNWAELSGETDEPEDDKDGKGDNHDKDVKDGKDVKNDKDDKDDKGVEDNKKFEAWMATMKYLPDQKKKDLNLMNANRS